MRLLEGVNAFVDRSTLRNDVTTAQKKGPAHLLSRLIASVFTTEQLAYSCGQGIVTSKGASDGQREPLDAEKISACKGNVKTSR